MLVSTRVTSSEKLSWPTRSSDGRSLTEPPIFSYNQFEREYIPSDKMLNIAFPVYRANAIAYKDVLTEIELLLMFLYWITGVRNEELQAGPRNSSKFYQYMSKALNHDWNAVAREINRFRGSLTGLEKWKTRFLDKNGKLESVRSRLEVGEDLFTYH